jgi:hypothetical protein
MAHVPLSAKSRKARSDLANAVLAGEPATELDRLRAEFELAKYEDMVDAIVDAAPPLSDEAKQRIASLLTTSGNGREAA